MKHIVGFSGGVDSQACARWVLNRFPWFEERARCVTDSNVIWLLGVGFSFLAAVCYLAALMMGK